jgi:NAD(P)-dependent dehydrogenase (short-subunit alcohol dehydrogenase family)
MATLWFMFKGKLFPPAQVTTSFADKTVLVTGSNTGVGYQAALKYVQHGASTVILGVRSLGKGQQAASAIEATTDRKGVVRVWELDMSRFTSVDEFARRVDRELPRLDIAVLNAGVLDQGYKVSPDGWETMLQVNLLSTMLLALLLTPKLKASRSETSRAHLTVVASTGHLDVMPRVPSEGEGTMLQSYNKKEGFAMMERYSLSKLFVMWVTRVSSFRGGLLEICLTF